MNTKYLIAIGIGSAVIVGSIAFFTMKVSENVESFEFDFTYSEANSELKNKLETNEIYMSSPIVISEPSNIQEFCSFFQDENIQKLIEYCTSTELLGSSGNFLGNVHMVGSQNMPKIVLVLIQTNPFMNNIDQVKTVFRTTIEALVCNCWEQIKPSGIQTIDDWIDQHRQFHSSATKPHSKSSLNLVEKQIQIELTTNQDGYLWKLIVSK